MPLSAAKLRWYVHRMRAMTPSEMRNRVVERYRHATQRQYLKQLHKLVWDDHRADAPELPDRSALPVSLRQVLAEDAERFRGGHWKLFGWREVNVGTPPNWHRDPVSGTAIPQDIVAHRLDHRHLPHDADARALWEINRWAELTRLAMHGWASGDDEALRTAQEWLADWCDRNPVGAGINWTSPLEAALRLLNFAWIDALACSAGPQFREAQDTLARRIVPVHAAWIWRHRSFGSSANNHLLGELAALTVAASRWPGLAPLACDAATAWNQLSGEILRQFAEDGGSREQALHYHLFAWELSWHAMRAVGCTDGPAHERLLAALQFVADIAPPAGSQAWDFGDSDDAQVIPLATNRSTLAAELKAWLQGQTSSAGYWLGPPPPLPVLEISPDVWKVKRHSGVAVRHTATWFLRLDASPLGFGALAAHGHCDALHLSVWEDGEALLIDPGTGGYFAATEERARLAAWEAHNGPQPATGFRTPVRMGPFLQTKHHRPPCLKVSGGIATAEFCHEGYHFRRIVRASGRHVSITDLEKQGRPFRVCWQFAPGCSLAPLSTERAAFSLTKNLAVWHLEFDARSPEIAVVERQVSPAFGCYATAPAVEVTATAPIRLIVERKR